MNGLQLLILFAWFTIPIRAAVFLFLFGWPSKKADRVMAWHLALTTLVAGLEPVGFLLSGLSLWPSALIYVGSMAIMDWRLALLIQQRRRERRARAEAVEESTD